MMLTKMQKLADKILLSESDDAPLKGFASVDEIIDVLFDERYKSNFENLSSDEDVVKKLKATDIKIIEDAMTKVYNDYVENADEKSAPLMQFGKCVFNYLNEIKHFKDKVL